MAAVTMPVLDRPSERAVQIRQSARKAFFGKPGCTGGKTTSVEGVPGWRSSCVLAKGQRAGNAFWTRSLAWQSNYAGSVSWFQECVGGIQTSVTHGVSGTVAHGHSH